MISSLSLLAMILVLKPRTLLASSAARGKKLYTAELYTAWLIGIKDH